MNKESNIDRPARCACGAAGTLRAMRAHLRTISISNANSHVLTSYGGCALELSTLARGATIAWATADRDVQRSARVIQQIEQGIRELAADVALVVTPCPPDIAERERLAVARDEAVIALRAAELVRAGYEATWRQAARDLLEEMSPADDDGSPCADEAGLR